VGVLADSTTPGYCTCENCRSPVPRALAHPCSVDIYDDTGELKDAAWVNQQGNGAVAFAPLSCRLPRDTHPAFR